METKALRIVYMGTPEFAVPPLEKLLNAGYDIRAVITAPDKPAGRGKKIRFSAVKDIALRHELRLLQPSNLKDPDFLESLRELEPDLQVVVAFRMLPEAVWQIPRLGTFNLHASLLPQYRGAAPINHVILNGESTTGLSTFMIDEKIDTGNILLQSETGIGENESAGELHDRLMPLGAELVLETVRQLGLGKLQARSQDQFTDPRIPLKKAPKIFKEDCRINWDRPGLELFNMIRGLSPYPGAFTCLERISGEKLICKLYASRFESIGHAKAAGSMHSDGRKYLKVAVKDGFLSILSIQQEGKRKMEIADFLAGISLSSFQPRFS